MSHISRIGAAAVAATLSTMAAAAVERAGVPDNYRLSMQTVENCMKSQMRIIERATREPKCDGCSLLELCLPEPPRGRTSAARYIRQALAAEDVPDPSPTSTRRR